jgi:hypothetical protein
MSQTTLSGLLQIKALSVKQPYATWIAEGKKTIEIRTWRTKFRGRFLIVSSRATDLLFEEIGPDNLGEGYRDDWPLGMALAEASLVDCRSMTEDDEKAACCEFYDGAFAWILADVKRIEPFPVKGQLSFFTVQLPKPMEAT